MHRGQPPQFFGWLQVYSEHQDSQPAAKSVEHSGIVQSAQGTFEHVHLVHHGSHFAAAMPKSPAASIAPQQPEVMSRRRGHPPAPCPAHLALAGHAHSQAVESQA